MNIGVSERKHSSIGRLDSYQPSYRTLHYYMQTTAISTTISKANTRKTQKAKQSVIDAHSAK